MPQKRTLNAKDVLTDIRSGMYDEQLMQKYKLSPASLKSLFSKMVQRGFITQSELDQRAQNPERTVDLVTMEAGEVPSGLRHTMNDFWSVLRSVYWWLLIPLVIVLIAVLIYVGFLPIGLVDRHLRPERYWTKQVEAVQSEIESKQHNYRQAVLEAAKAGAVTKYNIEMAVNDAKKQNVNVEEARKRAIEDEKLKLRQHELTVQRIEKDIKKLEIELGKVKDELKKTQENLG
jgi:hypothetical protein